jgi:AcrR family transcriptional regulator
MRRVDPVRHEEKRQQILAAAEACFARKGFQGATISDICAEAKMSPGHLYHYFASKEGIIASMAESRLEIAADSIARIQSGPDIVAALIGEIHVALHNEETASPPLSLEILAEAARNPVVAKIVREHSRAVRHLLADVLRKGQAGGQVDSDLDPDLAAALLLGIVDGAKALTVHDPSVDRTKASGLIKILVSRFLLPPAQ